MKPFRSTFSIAVASLCLAALPILAVAVCAALACIDVLRRCRDRMFEAFLKTFETSTSAPSKPRVLLLVAKQLHLRLVKREVPTIQAGWRLCPSVG